MNGKAQLFSFGSFLLGGDCYDSDVDMLVVVPQHVDRALAFFESNQQSANRKSLSARLQANPRVEKLVEVRSAFVPCLKLTFAGIAIDLTFANVLPSDGRQALALPQQPTGPHGWQVNPDEYIGWSEQLLARLESDRPVLRSINGVRTAHWILKSVPDQTVFRTVLLLVKQWAKSRGIYGGATGYFGGVSWGLLVAYICRAQTWATPMEILQTFFATWLAWPWPNPVELTPRVVMQGRFSVSLDLDVWDARTSASKAPILTPTYPSMNTAHSVSQSTFETILLELSRASKIFQRGSRADDSDWPDRRSAWWYELVEPVDASFVEQHPVFLHVTVYAKDGQTRPRWSELCQANLRHVVRGLERTMLFVSLRPLQREARHTCLDNLAEERDPARAHLICQGHGIVIGMVPVGGEDAAVAAECDKLLSALSQQLVARAASEGWHEAEMKLEGQVLRRDQLV